MHAKAAPRRRPLYLQPTILLTASWAAREEEKLLLVGSPVRSLSVPAGSLQYSPPPLRQEQPREQRSPATEESISRREGGRSPSALLPNVRRESSRAPAPFPGVMTSPRTNTHTETSTRARPPSPPPRLDFEPETVPTFGGKFQTQTHLARRACERTFVRGPRDRTRLDERRKTTSGHLQPSRPLPPPPQRED